VTEFPLFCSPREESPACINKNHNLNDIEPLYFFFELYNLNTIEASHPLAHSEGLLSYATSELHRGQHQATSHILSDTSTLYHSLSPQPLYIPTAVRVDSVSRAHNIKMKELCNEYNRD
jgi:hypothetical protein